MKSIANFRVFAFSPFSPPFWKIGFMYLQNIVSLKKVWRVMTLDGSGSGGGSSTKSKWHPCHSYLRCNSFDIGLYTLFPPWILSWIHVNTINCYMVQKDVLEPICTINHGKAFHAKVQYRLILLMSSDCCLGCLNPFPFQIFVPSIIMIWQGC